MLENPQTNESQEALNPQPKTNLGDADCSHSIGNVLYSDGSEEVHKLIDSILTKKHQPDWWKDRIEFHFLNKGCNFSQKGLEEYIDKLHQLDSKISFTEKGGLQIQTGAGMLTFSMKTLSFDDVKDVPGIKLGKNVIIVKPYWHSSENLRINCEAVGLLRDYGIRIPTADEFDCAQAVMDDLFDRRVYGEPNYLFSKIIQKKSEGGYTKVSGIGNNRQNNIDGNRSFFITGDQYPQLFIPGSYIGSYPAAEKKGFYNVCFLED